MNKRLLGLCLLCLLICAQAHAPPSAAASATTVLSSHWVPGWGFRDELNPTDADYQNFWTDNAGKILVASLATNDAVDAGRALGFIQDHITPSGYLPEALVNSSMVSSVGAGGPYLSNRIAMLQGDNGSSELQELSVGNYYAGLWSAGYLGADRIWYNNSAFSASSASVFVGPNGFVKRSYFAFDGVSFYTYLNATITVGDPYVVVSVQVEPLDSAFGVGDHIYLQVFASATGASQQYAFENATLFDPDGGLVRTVPFKGAVPLSGGGILVSYSNRTSTLAQDSVALRYDGSGINDAEHWYRDGPFGGLTWTGLGYNVPSTNPGELSTPVYAEVYPVQHLDFRLLSDTMKYIASNPKDMSVATPASFGFVAYGLAMEAAQHPGNQTLGALARGYWNSYYDRYVGTDPGTAYARATNVLSLAGFELYGGNSTVENFARDFVGRFPGASIEEYGWAAAALWTLYSHTDSASDLKAYQSVVGAFVSEGSTFIALDVPSASPGYTFQFAEAAAGLLIGKVPYNSSSVMWAMDAVFQANSSGVLLNQPYHGDLANTETIPAYMIATWLFQASMRSATHAWIASIHNANITAIDYVGGRLSVRVVGNDGSVALGTPSGVVSCSNVDGGVTLTYANPRSIWFW